MHVQLIQFISKSKTDFPKTTIYEHLSIKNDIKSPYNSSFRSTDTVRIKKCAVLAKYVWAYTGFDSAFIVFTHSAKNKCAGKILNTDINSNSNVQHIHKET